MRLGHKRHCGFHLGLLHPWPRRKLAATSKDIEPLCGEAGREETLGANSQPQ